MTSQRAPLLHPKQLLLSWLLLLAITLAYALLAEGQGASTLLVLLICVGITLKGRLVVERLMGLAGTAGPVRGTLLSYFYLLPTLIALAWIHADTLRRWTTL